MAHPLPKRSLHTAQNRSQGSSSHIPLILASTSPRRKRLLHEMQIPFESCAPDVDETWEKRGDARGTAVELAVRKARACARPHAIVIGMDTVVVLGRRLLGKPRNEADAAEMLKALSGRSHRVITGVALLMDGRLIRDAETTRVCFRKITTRDIEWYLRTGEPMDKAGAYGIQGYARFFVRRIDGCFFNVVGFPVVLFQKMLARFGYDIRAL